jgi:Fe-S oxidoreductase
LWVDTFNNHWQPAVPIAAVEVLEDAGYQVVLPAKRLCCGRPLYDYGMLERARKFLAQVLDALEPALDEGLPIVGLEPSCVTVFRDELPDLFPDDPRAEQLAQRMRTLDEFLDGLPDFQPPRLSRRAIVQAHCHHHAIVGLGAEKSLLARMGLSATVLDSGCCGMAGAFGYEKERYPVSVACAERKLLPAVRDAEPDTIVIADGFSCRQQIEQGSERAALHLAQVLQMAREHGPHGPREGPPERGYASLALPVPSLRTLLETAFSL